MDRAGIPGADGWNSGLLPPKGLSNKTVESLKCLFSDTCVVLVGKLPSIKVGLSQRFLEFYNSYNFISFYS